MKLEDALRHLARSAPIGMPTETVYGLAAPYRDERAVARVFEIKARPRFDPLIVHVLDIASFEGIDWDLIPAQTMDTIRRLTRAFSPGPLTLVLPRTALVPELVSSGLPTVAVRAPSHPVARALIEKAGPLAAPSANRFGRVSPTQAKDVEAELGVPALDGGDCEIGIESTVLGLSDNSRMTLLRRGGIPSEEIEAITGPLLPPPNTSHPVAPGMIHSHYAPGKSFHLLPEALSRMTEREWQGIDQRLPPGKRAVLIIGDGPTDFPGLVLRLPDSPIEAARVLFTRFRQLDESDAEVLLCEPVPWTAGLGPAIADRVRRATANGLDLGRRHSGEMRASPAGESRTAQQSGSDRTGTRTAAR